MSLAPREQRALASIEHSLHRSDPRLAAMLATFTLPAFRGGIAHLCRSRGRDFLPPALALVLIGVIICCGALLGHPGPGSCALTGLAGRTAGHCPAARGYRDGVTTRALPPPRRTGSATAS